jgi:hypothetical protein
MVILGIWHGVNAAPTATINGINCYIIRLNEFSIGYANVPHDNTATITVTAASSLTKAVSVFIAYPQSPIPLDFVTASANTTTNANAANIKTQAGGCIIYSGGQNATLGAFTTTWNGPNGDPVNESVDAQLEAGSYTSGFINITRSNDLGDLNMAETVSGTKRLITVSFGPPLALTNIFRLA